MPLAPTVVASRDNMITHNMCSNPITPETSKLIREHQLFTTAGHIANGKNVSRTQILLCHMFRAGRYSLEGCKEVYLPDLFPQRRRVLYKSLALVSILGVVGLVLIVRAQSDRARESGEPGVKLEH